jgi:hypothetical protein
VFLRLAQPEQPDPRARRRHSDQRAELREASTPAVSSTWPAWAIEVAYGPASTLCSTNAVSRSSTSSRAPEGSKGGEIGLWPAFATRSIDFEYGTHDPDDRVGFTLAGMYKQTDKADLRGRKGDGNWTDALDNFETDAAIDGRLRVRDLSVGLTLQDKDASRATVQRTVDTASAITVSTGTSGS